MPWVLVPPLPKVGDERRPPLKLFPPKSNEFVGLMPLALPTNETWAKATPVKVLAPAALTLMIAAEPPPVPSINERAVADPDTLNGLVILSVIPFGMDNIAPLMRLSVAMVAPLGVIAV